jgi:hypothetical protein
MKSNQTLIDKPMVHKVDCAKMFCTNKTYIVRDDLIDWVRWEESYCLDDKKYLLIDVKIIINLGGGWNLNIWRGEEQSLN